MSYNIFTFQMNIICHNISFDLNIYVDDKDYVVGIYYTHSQIRGAKFKELFSKEYPPHPNPNKLLIFKELKQFFKGNISSFSVPYKFITGTEFQLSVWKEIAHIPIHQAVSYKYIASKISDASSTLPTRAVGSASGTNPLAILIPCHRVLPNALIDIWDSIDLHTCNIGNYGGGASLKRALLLHEATIV